MLTKEYLWEVFNYVDGVLYWKVNKGTVMAGRIAGKLSHKGYWQVQLDKKQYSNHRLIFLMFNGHLPEYLDHIDNDSTNNRIENLRPATAQQNAWNRNMNGKQYSGIKGVIWNKTARKWQAQLTINGKNTYLGTYDDKDKAAQVVKEAREKQHKEFTNHA